MHFFPTWRNHLKSQKLSFVVILISTSFLLLVQQCFACAVANKLIVALCPTMPLQNYQDMTFASKRSSGCFPEPNAVWQTIKPLNNHCLEPASLLIRSLVKHKECILTRQLLRNKIFLKETVSCDCYCTHPAKFNVIIF